MTEKDKQTIQTVFDYFKGGFRSSSQVKSFLKGMGLDLEALKTAGVEIGYNSAQFHHREGNALIQDCLKVGLLTENPSGGFRAWGKMGAIFPLRNQRNEITNLYALKIGQSERVDIFLNDEGVFPAYPKPETKSLIVADGIIDACLLVQNPSIQESHSVLALDGYILTEKFNQAIEKLTQLEEMIFINIPSADVLGLAQTLKEKFPKILFSAIQLLDKEQSIQSLLVSNQPIIIPHLIERRKSLFQNGKENAIPDFLQDDWIPATAPLSPHDKFITSNPFNIQYSTANANYSVLGGVRKELDSLRITLLIENKENRKKSRKKLDLYEDYQVEKICIEVSEKLNLRMDLLEMDLLKLTDLLEEYRTRLFTVKEEEHRKITLSVEENKQCKEVLSQLDLLTRINDLIGKGGIVGEETNRLFLFIIASSYKMPEPLNALIQGTSGSGKTHLLNKILSFMPDEDVITMTRVSEKSFYNFDEEYLDKKLIGLEDLDGLKDEAFLAFRELQTRGQLSSSISYKDGEGGIRSKIKLVRGSIASVSCTTKGEIYEDNMNRCFLVAVDESEEQTDRIIKYQNKKSAGKVNKEEQVLAQKFLQNCIRKLDPVEVINPFAEKIHLPKEVHKIRRLNQLYQSFVKQITILHQFQREKDKKGRVITDKEDLRLACEIMFDSIHLKIDELDGSLRRFYERLKGYVKEQSKTHQEEPQEGDDNPTYSFTQREIRHAMRQSKSQLQRYINDLMELEYIRLINRNSKGFRYKITHWDDLSGMKEKTRSYLNQQLGKL